MSTQKKIGMSAAFIGVLLLAAGLLPGADLAADLTGVPSCNGLSATIYVGSDNLVVGGPDNGKSFGGILNGTSGDDVMVGTIAADTINGRNGSDVACGGGGADTIGGDYGNDVIFGEDGDDALDGNQDDDQVYGGEGDDRITGGYGIDLLYGENGIDTMEGNQNDDRILGGAGNDSIDGGYGVDVLCGNDGDDALSGRPQDDELDGGPGTDTLDGDAGTDVCRNGETMTACEDSAAGLVAACGDSYASSVSSVAESSADSQQSSSILSSSSSAVAESSAVASSSAASSAQPSGNGVGAASGEQQPSVSGGGGGGGGGGGEVGFPVFRGSGIAEMAAVTHTTLVTYGLHTNSPYKYSFHHDDIRPIEFASHAAAEDWTLRVHATYCSIYRYLTRVREGRQFIKPGYIDWLAGMLADAVGEDFDVIRAAILGQSHTHKNTGSMVRSIAGEGCTENDFVYRDDPSAPHGADQGHAMHMEHATGPSADDSLTIEQREIPGEIAFAVRDGEAVFTDYGVSHTKEMHLLVVRDDLRHFSHIHPERDADGVWHVPFVAPAGGTYWMYADFIGADNSAHTIRFERTYDGDLGQRGVLKNMDTEKIVDGYVVEMRVNSYEDGMMFTFDLRDAKTSEHPILEEYLGAMGHGILLSPTGAFIHTHPSPAGDTLIFHAPKLVGDFYRVFTQFSVDGTVHTAVFDWTR